jgi:UPF0755 protein
MKKLFAFIFLGPIVAGLLLAIHVTIMLKASYEGPDMAFKIKRGEGFASINQRLYKEGLIENKRLFHYYSRYKKLMTKFRSGTYMIKSGSTMPKIIEELTQGVVIGQSYTVPEGKNMYEIGQMLESNGICKKSEFLKTVRNKSFLQKFKINAQSAEGYLYPDTYKFSKNTPPERVAETMIQNFKSRTKKLKWNNSKYTIHQNITLASMVEKETGAKWERPIISGVFHNRLKKKMRLQSDPTTIYGIYERFDGNLRKKDLLEKTPYNTYKIGGLPIGPISNPGLEAIKAALNPKKHEYYYFVSHNDGTHEFTRTYKDHLKAVEKYQKTAKNRRGKSWRNLKK